MIKEEEDPSPPEVTWYYLDSIGQEYGPVKSKAMRGWLTQGCFPVGGDLLVRLPEWQWHMPLYTVFPNLSVAFLVPPLWPGFAPKSLWAELQAPLQWQTENPMNETPHWASAASNRSFGDRDARSARSFSTLPDSGSLLAAPGSRPVHPSKLGTPPAALGGLKGHEALRRAATPRPPPGAPGPGAPGSAPMPAAAGRRRGPSLDAVEWQHHLAEAPAQCWPWRRGAAPPSGCGHSAPSRGPAALLRAGWGGAAGPEQPAMSVALFGPSAAAWDGSGGRGVPAASRSLPPPSWRHRGSRAESPPLPPAHTEGRQRPAEPGAAVAPAANEQPAAARPHFEPPPQSGRRFSGIVRVSETDPGKGTIISPEAKRVYGGESPLITDIGSCKDGDEVIFRVRIGEGGVPEVNSLMRLTCVNPRMPPEARGQAGPPEPPKNPSGEGQNWCFMGTTGSSGKAHAGAEADTASEAP